MKILITGGAGFIGSNLAKTCNEAGHEVIILDNLSTGSLKNIEELTSVFIRKDIRENLHRIKEIENIDVIFHLAAFISVPESFEKEEECYNINIKGTKNLLDFAVKNKVKKFIITSSAAVYGNLPSLPKTEESTLKPESPYAISKIKCEELIKDYYKKYGLYTLSLRLFNVFGPNQNPDSAYAAVIPSFIKSAKNNEDIIIHGSGEQTRDFIYIKDVCSAFLSALKKPLNGKKVNISSNTEATINYLAKEIKETLSSESKIKHIEKREGDILRSRGSNLLAKKILDFQPKYSLKKGLKEMLKN